ncbi:distal tail protein Dit [Clostridium sp.]|uniref:distal tail protein Dit n=1 Tax=Clostridium sp. TaxID=1506 RepID=UPI002FC96BD7
MSYINYNDVDLSNIIKIKSVDTVELPPLEHSTIDIWERVGAIYNGCKKKPRPIDVTFRIKPSREDFIKDLDCLDNYKEEVKRCFNVDEPKELFLLDDSKFIFAMPIGDIKFTQINRRCVEGTISFICYDPYYYSENAKQFDGENNIICNNEGSVEACPVIDIGISQKSHFVQVENLNNGKKILIGNYPITGNTTITEKSTVLSDNCEQTTGWTTGSSSVDNDREINGTLSVTNSGAGICVGSFGSKGSANWYGTSARKNLDTQVQDFFVECHMSHNSTGVNGDPSIGNNNTETSISGTKKTYYKVTATSLNVRSGPGTNYKRIGSIKKGTKVTPTSVSKGWAKFIYKGKVGYVYTSYMKKYISDNTVTESKRNYVCNVNTAIRSTYKQSSTNKCTIPAGVTIRCLYATKYLDPTDKKKERYYFKLAEKYKGHTGYVLISNLTQASNVEYDYPDKLDTADDKTGMVEVYGYTANNEKLFKMGLYDDNKYYEFTYPLIQIGSSDFLKDNTTAPKPKEKVSVSGNDDKLTVTKDYLLSGRYGDWNEFYGKLGIQRKDGKWKAWIYKIKDGKTVKQKLQNEKSVSGSNPGKLAYVVCYFGTSADSSEKASGVSVSHVSVKNLNPRTYKNENVEIFDAGDMLKVDCYNNRVWLNDKPLDRYVDIGSQFFELETGENTIKINSDDKEISASIIFNERWL